MLSGLVAASEKTRKNALPRLELSRCLLARNSNSTCNRCQTACQSNAINLKQKPLSLDNERCNGCLACTRKCKTGALALPLNNLHESLDTLGRNSLLVISCTKNFLQETHIKLPCLGGLPEELLVALLAGTSARITVDLSPCQNCEKKAVSRTVEESARRIAQIFPAEMTTERLTVRRKQTVGRSSDQERRAFFRSLCDVALVVSRNILTAPPQDQEKSFSRKNVPAQLLLLHYALDNSSAHMAALIAKNFFHTMHVAPSCNLCGACVGVCPSGALHISGSETNKALMFHPRNCTGCEACSEICGQASMHLVRGANQKNMTGYPVRRNAP